MSMSARVAGLIEHCSLLVGQDVLEDESVNEDGKGRHVGGEDLDAVHCPVLVRVPACVRTGIETQMSEDRLAPLRTQGWNEQQLASCSWRLGTVVGGWRHDGVTYMTTRSMKRT